MPTLSWIGKEKIVNHHRDVPFKVLEHKYGFSAENGETKKHTNSGNKIIHGDNLEVLKALLPEYEGRIKCVYIDPPYNTGKDQWRYNDNVDHPKLKNWLKEVVGKEGEDLSRHDKWLCMIYPRLSLMHKLLKPEGVIFVSIDDNEMFGLKLIMDEIFGPTNFLGNIIWETATDNNPRQISIEHEYVLCYSKNHTLQNHWFAKSHGAELIQKKYRELKEEFEGDIQIIEKHLRHWIKINKESLSQVTHYDNVDPKGVYHDADVANTKFGGYKYDIIHPQTKKVCKIPEKGYRYPEQTMQSLIEKDEIMFGADEKTLVKPKKRLEDVKDRLRSVLYEDGRASTKELEKMFQKEFFKNPKSENILRRLLSFCTSDNDIILDSFAGSGTTAHAVANLNKQDGGNRKFILVEMEEYAETITAERIKRVMRGYADVPGISGSFDFYDLGEQIFGTDNPDDVNTNINSEKIREYVWYSETRSSYNATQDTNESKWLLGKKDDTAYYFVYEKNGSTTLDYDLLPLINTEARGYVVYADNCLLPKEFMLKHNIIFKKIPKDIMRF